jgi:PKD repeat protein
MKKRVLLFIGLVLSLAYSGVANAQCTAPLTITPTGTAGEVQLEYDLGGVASPATFVGEVYFSHTTNSNYNAYTVILQGNNPDVLTLPAGGTYDITSFTYDSLGSCYDTIYYSYTDNTLPLPCNTSMVAYALDSANTTFYFEVTGASTNATFTWNFGDGNTSTQNPTTHTYSPNGSQNYFVTVDVQDGNCSDSLGQSITAGIAAPPPNCDANFFIWQDSVNLSQFYGYNYSTGNNLTYLWDFGDGITSTDQFPVHNYSTTGVFDVCLTIDDGNGCTDTHCQTITIFTKAGSTLNIMDPNPGTADMEEINEIEDVLVYPNPTVGELTIQYTSLDSKTTMIQIIDAKGSLVYNAQINSQIGLNTVDIDLSAVEKGLYFYRIDNEFVGKVLVK